MPETDEATLNASTKQTKKTLQEFSQCTYDILQIVKTVIDHPGEYKELNQKYFDLSNFIDSMMSSIEGFKFIEEEYVLPLNFLYLPYREESDRKVLYKAETNLRDLLGRIEVKRRLLLGKDYKANTGIKDSELIAMLENIKNDKTIKKENLALADNKEDILYIEQEIEISSIAKNKYKNLKLILDGGKGYIQFGKGEERIDLGGFNTRTYRMAKYILMPTSKSKKVIDVYEHIKIASDEKKEGLKGNTTRSYQLKKEVIEGAVAELQKDKFLKGHVTIPKFDDREKIVTIGFK